MLAQKIHCSHAKCGATYPYGVWFYAVFWCAIKACFASTWQHATDSNPSNSRQPHVVVRPLTKAILNAKTIVIRRYACQLECLRQR
jgi:hypothetical protein